MRTCFSLSVGNDHVWDCYRRGFNAKEGVFWKTIMIVDVDNNDPVTNVMKYKNVVVSTCFGHNTCICYI